MKTALLLAALLSFATAVGAQPITNTLEKTPAYFYDRYGAPIQESTAREVSFWSPERGEGAVIRGSFSVRHYKSDRLTVTVIFVLPKLQAVDIQYSLGSSWTDEHLKAALGAYGDQWSMRMHHFAKCFFGSKGQVARVFGPTLRVSSAGVIQAIDREHAILEAQRKAVPRF